MEELERDRGKVCTSAGGEKRMVRDVTWVWGVGTASAEWGAATELQGTVKGAGRGIAAGAPWPP